MSIKFSYENIDQVFRNRDKYDEKKYVSRSRSEDELEKSINRYSIVFIQGESGCGKTWITTHVLRNYGKSVFEINMSEVSIIGGLIPFFQSQFSEVESEYSTSGEINLSLLGLGGKGETTTTYNFNHNFFWEFLQGRKDTVIKIDNLEAIVNNPQIINELISLITLTDDNRILDLGIKFVVIGAMDNIMDFLQRSHSYNTIATRAKTVRLKGFNQEECSSFVNTRFPKCGFSVDPAFNFADIIYRYTKGIPYSVNELSFKIAVQLLDYCDHEINNDTMGHIKEGIYSWITESLSIEYSLVRNLFYENLQKDELLNYVLYVLQDFDLKEFSLSELFARVESKLPDKKRLTPKSVKTYMDLLSNNTENSNIILKTQPDGYRIKSYKSLACISTVLYETENNIRFISDAV